MSEKKLHILFICEIQSHLMKLVKKILLEKLIGNYSGCFNIVLFVARTT